ncbi:hypothetical protein GE09DRAFT_1222305 [Coniochaeta sp. 2T2.1]|nr:hypothetical protein GE09DRAFT_1222305 [Coniochaeta sp. 2T2.1]
MSRRTQLETTTARQDAQSTQAMGRLMEFQVQIQLQTEQLVAMTGKLEAWEDFDTPGANGDEPSSAALELLDAANTLRDEARASVTSKATMSTRLVNFLFDVERGPAGARRRGGADYDAVMTFWCPHFDAIVDAKEAVAALEDALAAFQARFEESVHGRGYEGRKLEAFVVSDQKREAYLAAKARPVEWPLPFVQRYYAEDL